MRKLLLVWLLLAGFSLAQGWSYLTVAVSELVVILDDGADCQVATIPGEYLPRLTGTERAGVGELLNWLGAQGWELVSAYETPDRYRRFVFKRPASSPAFTCPAP
jgi:hypothetical protein